MYKIIIIQIGIYKFYEYGKIKYKLPSSIIKYYEYIKIRKKSKHFLIHSCECDKIIRKEFFHNMYKGDKKIYTSLLSTSKSYCQYLCIIK